MRNEEALELGPFFTTLVHAMGSKHISRLNFVPDITLGLLQQSVSHSQKLE